ncbi:acyltransferase [Curtobacterium sp. ODYSSEY 48 V2]|uniref:acyltransferase family protein n=1 Tax=Curtobacterium sp. ODYSSEY 48 V2 TaxID=2939561 RepID=UPI0020405196|nr:acyltransferase family protein [Curtobacterium sp. ODYSSEY 48 V2]MCM3504684.1 acyltransferase [Curtobacterium sp. ODYSSEY 48 V2]
MTSANKRRPDIEGLRGIAVLMVLLEHTFATPVGGFLGVDVFFVISGFVVGRGLLNEGATHGQIRIIDFFRRRARRLAPTALLVVGLTMAVSALFLRGSRREQTLFDGLAGLLGTANWRFITSDAGYFDGASAPSPFRHLWSLGVEEQCYFLLPLALLLVIRRRRLGLFVITAVVVASFAAAVATTAPQPVFAFYSTVTRLWQLGTGVGLALVAHRLEGLGPAPARAPRRTAVMAVSGLLLLVASALLIRPDVGVPFPAGLAPAAGTAMIIAAGCGAPTMVTKLLGARPLVLVGERSYALYMWHWPVLVLAPAVLGTEPVVALAIAVAAAVLSHAFVERPIRRRGSAKSQPTLAHGHRSARLEQSAGAVVALAIIATVTTASAVTRYEATAPPAPEPSAVDPSEPGPATVKTERRRAVEQGLSLRSWPDSLQPQLDELRGHDYLPALEQDTRFEQVARCAEPGQNHTVEQCTLGDGSRSLMIVGDSTAEFLTPAFRWMTEHRSGWKLIAGARYGCPFSTLELAHGDTDCSKAREEVVAHIAQASPDVLVVMNVLGPLQLHGTDVPESDRAAGVIARIDEVRAAVGSVAIVGPNVPGPKWDDCGSALIGPEACTGTTQRWRPSISADQDAARRSHIPYIDPTALWCAGGRCPAVIDDRAVSFDGTHATFEAAEDVAPALEDALVSAGVLPPQDGSTGGAAG